MSTGQPVRSGAGDVGLSLLWVPGGDTAVSWCLSHLGCCAKSLCTHKYLLWGKCLGPQSVPSVCFVSEGRGWL